MAYRWFFGSKEGNLIWHSSLFLVKTASLPTLVIRGDREYRCVALGRVPS